MNKQQTTSLLKEAANEIGRLRQSNTLMAARLDMFDKMVALFEANTNRNGHGCMSPDIYHELCKEAEALQIEVSASNMPTMQKTSI